ncbi:MAG: helix-turn-helix domain-containing protein [Pseudomonadota bacterium]
MSMRADIFIHLMEQYASGMHREHLGRTAKLVEAAAALAGCTAEEVYSPLQRKAQVHARFAAIAASYGMSNQVTLTTLGMVFNRDHTTILNAITKVAEDVGLPTNPVRFREACKANYKDGPFKQNFCTPSPQKMAWLRSMMFVEAEAAATCQQGRVG